jgi:serine/threonine-protein kinase
MTQTAAVIGTAQYLSPEQARGESVDARSDIYSTGCLLYELLTGRPPFVGDSPVSVAYQHVREEPRPPSMLDPEVPPVADAITLKALQKKPIDRYQSAAEMREDIDRALAGQQVTAPVVPVDATARFLPPDEPMDPQPTAQWERPPEDEPEEDEGPDRARKVAYVMLAISILFVLGVAAFIGIRTLGGKANTVTTPTLLNRTQDEAEQILARNDLRLGAVRTEASETVPKGLVMSQNPAPGDPVEVNGTVDITVSSGKPEVAIPEVIGMQVDEARALLESKGFEVTDREDPEADEPEGTVVEVEPEEGERVPAGSEVVLIYSSGLIEVPDVIGEDQSDAERELRREGFRPRPIFRTTSSASPGTVIDQTPSAGQRREKGTTVTIVIAAAPEPEPEPEPEPTTEPQPEPEPEPTTEPEPTPEPEPSPSPSKTFPTPPIPDPPPPPDEVTGGE